VVDAGGDFGGFGGGGLNVGGGPGSSNAAGPAPLHVWSDHTLPVAAVAVGAGGAGAIVVSASADRTVRVRALATGAPLRVVTLPAALRCLALDPGEHALWAGGADGVVYEVPLVPVAADGTADDSHGHGAAGHDAAAPTYVAMPGHAGGVAALALTADAAALVSGADDGALRVWDLRSRQPVRELPAPAKGPVTGLLVLDRPPAMPAGPGAGGGGRRGPRRPAPLAPLAKYAGAPGAGAPWEGPPVLLDGAAGGGEDSDDGELRGAMAPFDLSAAGYDLDAPAAAAAAAAAAPPTADAEMGEEEEEEADDAAPAAAAAAGGGARWAAVDAGLAEFVAGAGGA
jgi:pre-rRNA-processing protein IPI3